VVSRVPTRLAGLLLFAVATLAIAPTVGGTDLSLGDVTAGVEPATTIFMQLRLPRTLLAFVAGAGLAVSGHVYQAMFRNPLATPFTLGVASGASLGAGLFVTVGAGFSLAGFSGLTLFSFAGALAAVSLVYGLTMTRRGMSAAATLLAGVAVSFFFSSLNLFLQYIADFSQAFRIVRWLMGGLETVGYVDAGLATIFTLVGVTAALLFARELDLITTGDTLAASRGVDVARTKGGLLIATSLTVGGIVSLTGPIGFVGMMAPHLMRFVVGGGSRTLGVASALFGGAFLVACDTFARTVIAPAEIPVGVITALLGGPFFLWLLLARRETLKDLF
jgi:iron complex transport system permease protein